jgi:hypothetical protein
MADVKANKPESTDQESAPAQVESAPKKKGTRKRTAKKENTDNTEINQ